MSIYVQNGYYGNVRSRGEISAREKCTSTRRDSLGVLSGIKKQTKTKQNWLVLVNIRRKKKFRKGPC